MTERKPALARRTLIGGAATAGVAAAAAVLLPTSPVPAVPAAAPKAAAAIEPDGYQLTDHVKQYYASARV